MQSQQNKQDYSYLPYVVGSMVTVIILSIYFNLSQTFIIVLVVFAFIVLSSILLWAHANSHASGEAWWQDDRCSGWRGY